VTIELAGVGLEDLEVLLSADVLALQGVRRLPPEDRGRLYHAAQIQQGPFRLEVRLPAAIHAHSVETRYERGLLHLILPKLAEGKRHRR
jgi:HSP20 family protein